MAAYANHEIVYSMGFTSLYCVVTVSEHIVHTIAISSGKGLREAQTRQQICM